MKIHLALAKFREAVNAGSTVRQDPRYILRPGADIAALYIDGPFVWFMLPTGVTRVSPLANLVDAEVLTEPSRPMSAAERAEHEEAEKAVANPPDPDEEDEDEDDGEVPPDGARRKRGRPPKVRE